MSTAAGCAAGFRQENPGSPKGAAIFIADCLARDSYLLTNHNALDTTAELLGLDDAQAVPKQVAELAANGDGRAQVITLALVLGALEARTPKDAWRTRHTDLKEEFYARVRAQNRIPDSEKRLRDELETTQRRLADLHQQSRQQQQTIEALARIVNVLTVENDQLTTQLSHQRARKLVALQPEASGQ